MRKKCATNWLQKEEKLGKIRSIVDQSGSFREAHTTRLYGWFLIAYSRTKSAKDWSSGGLTDFLPDIPVVWGVLGVILPFLICLPQFEIINTVHVQYLRNPVMRLGTPTKAERALCKKIVTLNEIITNQEASWLKRETQQTWDADGQALQARSTTE